MMKIDQVDRRILSTLQTDARITNHKLADAVSLSPSACLTRVRRLEAAGYISSYRAVLGLEKITPYVEAFAEVTLENHSVKDFARFDKAVSAIEQITESYKISGPYDYLLKFICVDVRAYNVLSDQLIESGVGIEKITTLIILDNTKAFAGYPLDALL
ncbi:MAG: Lrp/AsnC family transcriptional regulator [Pseudomonadales bacterium]